LVENHQTRARLAFLFCLFSRASSKSIGALKTRLTKRGTDWPKTREKSEIALVSTIFL
jgi:hypothetical protein